MWRGEGGRVCGYSRLTCRKGSRTAVRRIGAAARHLSADAAGKRGEASGPVAISGFRFIVMNL